MMTSSRIHKPSGSSYMEGVQRLRLSGQLLNKIPIPPTPWHKNIDPGHFRTLLSVNPCSTAAIESTLSGQLG